jgi:hypothetical protein
MNNVGLEVFSSEFDKMTAGEKCAVIFHHSLKAGIGIALTEPQKQYEK